jgi:DNA-binding NtrC family response regulator
MNKPRPSTVPTDTPAAAKGPARLLVVDDDPIVAESLADFLRAEGYEAVTAASGAEALALLEAAEAGNAGVRSRAFSAALVDVGMPAMDGLALLREMGRLHPATCVVMLTGYGTIETAVASVRAGAVDFLTKPVIDAELRLAVERALRQGALIRENAQLRAKLDERFGLESIVGHDARMQKVYDLIEAVAPTRTTVLMMGESGTGKSLIARAIHQRSGRREGPFVELACGSIPETLLESELFGHVKGAFTGAHADKPGKFLSADGGTLFLDEINSASPGMQLKLLRALQERKFEPVGSSQTAEVDVRVILAGNQPLEQLVAQGTFRQDLYYRINVVRIDLPALRERLGDVPALAEHFLKQHASRLKDESGKLVVGFAPEAIDALRRYSFPGNVRELSNIVERAAVLTRTPTIGLDDLPTHVTSGSTQSPGGPLARIVPGPQGAVVAGHGPIAQVAACDGADGPASLEAALRGPERQIILKALADAGWNKAKAAEALNINRTTLYKKMKLLGIELRGDSLAG